jgi:hypothetical protein
MVWKIHRYGNSIYKSPNSTNISLRSEKYVGRKVAHKPMGLHGLLQPAEKEWSSILLDGTSKNRHS